MADFANDSNKQENAHGTKKNSRKDAFTIDFGNGSKSNLQESFLRFKKARQKEIAKRKKIRRARLKRQKNPKFMEELRRKFINQAKKYFGYPYARKYWPKDSEEYNSKLFLDCCGLVRQVVRDLASDFGFIIGPWNQAYMFDTLPIDVKTEGEMKPGDLVFMSGTYVNPNSKNQKHFMTHVEIWLGEGPKTIGARWNNGKVQIWNHYKFEAKSFTNTVYYFKSIDTWLKGICKSYCPEHKWKRSKFKPGKKSVFIDKKQKKIISNQDNNEQEGEQIGAQMGEQADELADEPGDEPDDYPDDGQGDEDQDQLDDEDQDDDDDDNDVDDEVQDAADVGFSDEEEITQYPEFSLSTAPLAESDQNISQDSNKLNLLNEKCPKVNGNGNEMCKNGKLQNFNLQQSETKLLHAFGDGDNDLLLGQKDNEFELGQKNKSIMKAGCDKSENANGDEKTTFIENTINDSDKVCQDLAIQLSDTSLGSSISTESTEPATEANVKETEEKVPRRGKKSPASRSTKLPQCSLPANMQPTFYIGGGNGVALVEGPLLALGWKRTTDKYDEKFRLKWVECKTRINYGGFKEGDQLVNHIPNGQLLTNKLGLLNSLQEYERVTLSTKGRPPRLKFSDFFPETYRLDEKNNKDTFLDVYQDGEMWICKPTGLNQGKGIFIIRTRDEINKLVEEREQKKEQMQRSTKPLMSRIVQRYIMNPLLLTGKKFDIRAYMLVASTVPFLVLYHKGYVRLSCFKYDSDDLNLSTHLTNQYVQKKEPNFKDMKEDTVWSMEKFNDYFNEKIAAKSGVEPDWVKNILSKQMQKIMIHCFNSVKHKLNQRIGYFDLFGLDFMVDTDLKVWLIEVNVNPSLAVTCAAQKEVVPGVVEESLYLAIECFEKTRKNQSLLPLNTLKNFSVLYCGTRPNAVPPRAPRSVSPVKEDKGKITNGIASSRARHGTDGRGAHRMSVSSTMTSSAGKKSSEDTSSNAAAKSGENVSKIETSEQPQSEVESVPLKMTHGTSSEVTGAKTGLENVSNDSEGRPRSKSIWTLGENGVLTLKSPNPEPTSSVTTTPNLDQIKSILAQIGNGETNNTSQAGGNVSSASVTNSSDNVLTASNSSTANVTKNTTTSEILSEKSSSSLPRSAFPSLISTGSSTVTSSLTSPGKPITSVSTTLGAGASSSTSTNQSASAPRSVPITTFSMSSVSSGHTSAQHERDRAETMAAYTTLAKLNNSSNLPSISQTNSVVKSLISTGNPNVKLSNVYKTTTNFENSPSLKFTSVGVSRQSSDTHIEVIPHRKHREHFERGS